MTGRLLPPEEWPRLAGTLLEGVWPSLKPDRDVVRVVEQDGEIIGCAALLALWHLEGAWIAPAHRKRAAVGRRLWAEMREEVRRRSVPEVWMMATSPDTARICERLGRATRLDCAHFAVMVGG